MAPIMDAVSYKIKLVVSERLVRGDGNTICKAIMHGLKDGGLKYQDSGPAQR